MIKEFSLKFLGNEDLISMLVSCFILCTFITFIFKKLNAFSHHEESFPLEAQSEIQKSRIQRKWTLKDAWYILSICTFYSIFVFWNLGTTHCPKTYWQPIEIYDSVTLQLEENVPFDAIYWISGEGNNNENPDGYQVGANFQIIGSNDLENWEHITTLENASFMEWHINDGYTWNFQYIRIIANSKDVVLNEIGLRKADHSGFISLQVKSFNESNPYSAEALIDEQDCLVLEPTFVHSTYFDEIYHTRNAYEIAENQHMYASVHPLLGTSIIALAIRLVGFNPLGWRIAGALFSILMLPLFYAILKRIFIQSRYCAIGTLLLAVDFMHYTTARIGTLEPFSVFFILLMYYFMIDYYYKSFYDVRFKSTLKPLAFSGISMGLAIACKWTGAYGAVGLAILFFITLFQRYQEYRYACKKEEKNEKEQFIVRHFPHYCIITLLWCILFFILIPILIYFLAYLPCMLIKNESYSIQTVINQTIYMFNYHTQLTATHPFQSTWIEWVLDTRPIWYYYKAINDGVYSISAFGNPFIWWSGAICILACIYIFIKKKTKESILVLVSYFSQLAPWLLVDRCVFIYHYYPSVPFLILAIVYCIYQLDYYKPQYRKHIQTYLFLCVGLFILFLPVIGGFKTTKHYIDTVLRWMTSWYFG